MVLFLNLEAVKEALLHGCFSCFFKLYEWCKIVQSITNPAGIYLLKVNNGSTRTRCEICSKLTIKIPEWPQYSTPCSSVSIVNFEHVIAGWEMMFWVEMKIELVPYAHDLLSFVFQLPKPVTILPREKPVCWFTRFSEIVSLNSPFRVIWLAFKWAKRFQVKILWQKTYM